MRFSTLIHQCGIPAYVDGVAALRGKLQREFWSAVWSCRILTIHHGEGRESFWAEPGKHAVNVVGFAIFSKPLPKDCQLVIGVGPHIGKLKELMAIVGRKA